MVKLFSDKDHDALDDAVRLAEKYTSTELAVIVAKQSDAYGAISIACGVTFGSFIALGLWHSERLTGFPQLLIVELLTCMLCMFIPTLRRACLIFAPRHFLKHRAAQRAAAEYVKLSHPLPAFTPVVLIYVSLLERYVHIYASRYVREKIPDAEWEAIVAALTESVRSDGLAQALINAVTQASDLLKAIFPDSGVRHHAPNVIEIIE